MGKKLETLLVGTGLLAILGGGGQFLRAENFYQAVKDQPITVETETIYRDRLASGAFLFWSGAAATFSGILLAERRRRRENRDLREFYWTKVESPYEH